MNKLIHLFYFNFRTVRLSDNDFRVAYLTKLFELGQFNRLRANGFVECGCVFSNFFRDRIN